MDWNWFFSSIAQSVAALVGVAGAFLVAKVLNVHAEFQRDRARSTALLSEGAKLQDSAHARHFGWLSERDMDDALSELTRKLADAGELAAPEDYLLQGAFPRHIPVARSLERIRSTIKEEKDSREEAARSRRGTLFGRMTLPGSRAVASITNPDIVRTLSARMEREREAINGLTVQVDDFQRRLSAHLIACERDPDPSNIVALTVSVLLLMFLAGVTYPLSFLPVPNGTKPTIALGAFLPILFSLRGVLLAIPTFAFGGLMVWLVVGLRRLRHSADDLAALRALNSRGAISPYLAVEEENEVAIREIKKSVASDSH
jgi:hypothetical protein